MTLRRTALVVVGCCILSVSCSLLAGESMAAMQTELDAVRAELQAELDVARKALAQGDELTAMAVDLAEERAQVKAGVARAESAAGINRAILAYKLLPLVILANVLVSIVAVAVLRADLRKRDA